MFCALTMPFFPATRSGFWSVCSINNGTTVTKRISIFRKGLFCLHLSVLFALATTLLLCVFLKLNFFPILNFPYMSVNSFPCSICDKQVRSDTIFCDYCELWVHRKCNFLSKSDFQKLVESDNSDLWSCFKCNCELFPMNRSDLQTPLITGRTKKSTDSSHPAPTDGDDVFLANIFDCNNVDIQEFNSLNFQNDQLSFFHLNICSLNKHFDSLNFFFQSVNDFIVIALSETRISSKLSSYSLDNYISPVIHLLNLLLVAHPFS